MAHNNFAFYVLRPLGRFEEALQQLFVAEKNDPLSPNIQESLADLLTSGGRYDEALGHCAKLPANYWAKSLCVGRARLGQGRIDEALQILETAFHRGVNPGSPVWGYLGYGYAQAGRRDEAEKLAAVTPSINPFNKATIFAGLGDKDRTFEALDRATSAGACRIGRALTLPEFAVLRGDPRVKALRKKAGLPE